MKTKEIKIDSCFSCPFYMLVPSYSEFKKVRGTTSRYCKHYGRDLISDIRKKPDFCKIVKISITEKD